MCGLVADSEGGMSVERNEKDHFPELTKMVPLTLEQLRRMAYPTPVWAEVEGKTIEGWDGYWCLCHRGRVLAPGHIMMYADSVEGVAFYGSPHAHIDREAWTAEWVEDGACDHKPYRVRDVEKWKKYKCSKCGYKAGRRNRQKFCPSCARAMTPEAWTELEKRLRG